MSNRGVSEAGEAACRGDIQGLERALQSPEILDERDDDGRTLLDLACRAATGDIAIPPVPGTPEQHAAVDMILRAGADPNVPDHVGWTPLHTAGMTGHADLARRLIEAHGKEGRRSRMRSSTPRRIWAR